MKLSYDQVKYEMKRVLVKHGFEDGAAAESAALFADSTADGVSSHGVNRFPRVVDYIQKGHIDVKAVPSRIGSLGALEKWDGNLGMGNLNARFCMNRAIELAGEHGIGAVALRNTNHWMRGGSYGWQAAEAGFIGICWTNTMPNMPAWGAKDRRIGNNPLIIAIPRKDGPIVFDAAMSQYSYGKIESTMIQGKQLPFAGGYDEEGNLSTDPASITETWRVLPVGFWKGSGLAIVLDLVAATLAEGNSTYQVGKLGGDEIAVSQIFIAVDAKRATAEAFTEQMLSESIADLKASIPASDTESIVYPGESSLRRRRENMKNGIEVEDAVWNTITAM